MLFDVWVRIEGVVESDDPHAGLHLLDKAIRNRLYAEGEKVSSLELGCPLSIIRCYDLKTRDNLDAGTINSTPCRDCK